MQIFAEYCPKCGKFPTYSSVRIWGTLKLHKLECSCGHKKRAFDKIRCIEKWNKWVKKGAAKYGLQ